MFYTRLFDRKSAERMTEPSPPFEDEQELEPDPPADAPRSTASSRFTGSLLRASPEKPRADRNREKAAKLNIDYDSLHEQSLASAAATHAKLVSDRAPGLLSLRG